MTLLQAERNNINKNEKTECNYYCNNNGEFILKELVPLELGKAAVKQTKYLLNTYLSM